MGFDFSSFNDDGLQEGFVQWLIEHRWPVNAARYNRLWNYYTNPMINTGGSKELGAETSRNYVQAQEAGLPARITGKVVNANGTLPSRPAGDIQRKEVVIENDIAWRINAMVDFLFGKGVEFVSRAADDSKRREIEQILKAVFGANGGPAFFQDLAVLGSVYGFTDCLVRPGDVFGSVFQRATSISQQHSRFSGSFETLLQLASGIGLELIEAPRALPILSEGDYRNIQYYVQHFTQPLNSANGQGSFLNRFLSRGVASTQRQTIAVTEIIGPKLWQRYEEDRLAAEGANVLGFVPVVHIQNIAQPYSYPGFSDAEQLIGLQDELNTRLSDRASRITMQAFKMYLAKGIEGLGDKPVSPGRMWCTDNEQASIEEFGGDRVCPSEDQHIAEIREAMDKVSGVTPVVAGVLKNKLGNLTSGVALKMTFMGMLTRNARKQFTYGRGLQQIAQMILAVLDNAGVYKTTEPDRQVDITFPDPLPEDAMQRLQEAQIKRDLGVSEEKVLEELGYHVK